MLELARCPACGRLAAGMSEWPVDQPVRCPYCRAEFVFGGTIEQPLRELIPVAPGEDQTVAIAGAAPVAEAVPETRVESPAGVSAEPSSDVAAESPPERPADRFVVGQPVRLPPSYAGAYDFLPEEQKRQLETAGAVAARLRGNTRGRGCLGELIKMALGGVLGLAIGYWLLNYFGGARFDWLQIYLPGCPHTQDHWPAEYLRQKPAEPPSPGPEEKGSESIPPAGVPESSEPMWSQPATEPAPSERPADSVSPQPAPESSKPDEPPKSAEPALQEDTAEVPTLPGLDEVESTKDEVQRKE